MITGGLFCKEIVRVEFAVPPATRTTLLGVKVVERPLEEIWADRLTLPVKPFKPLNVTVDEAVEPTCIVREEGLDVMLKSHTLTVTVAVCCIFPLVPVTVTV